MNGTLLALDPASHITGMAVWSLDFTVPEPSRLLHCSALVAPDAEPFTRVTWLRQELLKRLADYGLRPTILVQEHLIGAHVRKAFSLETAVSGFRALADEQGWRYIECQPNVWRQVVQLRRSNRVDKEQVRWVMEARIPQLAELRDVKGGMDAVEAAAIGLYMSDQLRLGLVPRDKQAKKRRRCRDS